MFTQALQTLPAIQWQPQFDGTEECTGVRALTYEGMPVEGKPTRVFAYYARPAGTHPVPGIVLLHGGGGHAFSHWVRLWTARGFAAIAMDTTGYFPRCVNAGSQEGQQEMWTRTPGPDLLPPGYAQAPDNIEMRDDHKPAREQWMYHALCDAILAHNILRAMPDVDNMRIGVTGISWGGVLTSLVIGHDPRFAYAVPVYGSGYLAPSKGILASFFQSDAVAKLWRAEDRFDQVRMPVMWLCWNEDLPFSLEANTRSYLDTCSAHPMTCLSAVHDMRHSHWHTWYRPETYVYAEMICGMRDTVQRPEVTCSGRHIRVEAPDAVSLRLFWLEEPMTYSVHMSRWEGEGIKLCQDQTWHFAPIQNEAELPEKAVGWYVEAEYALDEEPGYILTTPYTEK